MAIFAEKKEHEVTIVAMGATKKEYDERAMEESKILTDQLENEKNENEKLREELRRRSGMVVAAGVVETQGAAPSGDLEPTVVVTDLSEEDRLRMDEERDKMGSERDNMREDRRKMEDEREAFSDERKKFLEEKVMLQGEITNINTVNLKV